MCQSPRHELRRLGAKALASLSWDGHTDSRTLGTHVRDQWRLWVDVAANREEHHLRREAALLRDGQSATSKSAITAHVEAVTLVTDDGSQPHTDDDDHAAAAPDRAVLRNVVDIADGDAQLSSRVILYKPNPAQLTRLTARDVAVARRQWALRRRRACEGPNRENMRILASPAPTKTAEWLGLSSSSEVVANTLDDKYASLRAGPAIARKRKSLSSGSPPLVATLLSLAYERDDECVLAAARGLAAASYDSKNASTLGRVDGIIQAVVFLAKHTCAEVTALACDVRLASACA